MRADPASTKIATSIPARAAIPNSYADYGCVVNRIPPEDLLRRYEQAGFLYPAKRERLAPFLPEILQNLRAGLRGGELIHYVTTFEDPKLDTWAAVSAWRSTHRGWQSQHLTAIGSPLGSRAVMLSSQAVRIHDDWDTSYQNWFRLNNRFAAKVFGSIVQTLGSELAWVGEFRYVGLPLKENGWSGGAVRTQPCRTPAVNRAVAQLATAWRSPVYARAYELEGDDIELQAVDELYRLVGLRRFRRVWAAYAQERDQPIGIAIAHRGPLGFNFSFLENRCELLLDPELEPSQRDRAALALVAVAKPLYQDFSPGFLPVVCDTQTVGGLIDAGGQPLQDYAQSIWLREGFQAWYQHTESFYERIVRAERHHRLGIRRGNGLDVTPHQRGAA